MEGFPTISGGWGTGRRQTPILNTLLKAALAMTVGFFTYEAMEWYQSRTKPAGLRQRLTAMLRRAATR